MLYFYLGICCGVAATRYILNKKSETEKNKNTESMKRLGEENRIVSKANRDLVNVILAYHQCHHDIDRKIGLDAMVSKTLLKDQIPPNTIIN